MNNEYKVMCDRCKRLYNSLAVANCKHEAVNQYFGNHICIHCCKKCKHHTTMPYCDAVGCSLTTTNNNL